MKPEPKEHQNQATLKGLEDFRKERVALTIDEVKKMRDKAEDDIKKILIELIENSGVIPEVNVDIQTVKELDGHKHFAGLNFEIGIKI